MPLKATTKLACEIARIEPTKVADAIKLNHFVSAPETTAGAARVYEINDIVLLCVFAFLTQTLKVSASNAGVLVQEIKNDLRDDTDFITFCWAGGRMRMSSVGYLPEDKVMMPAQERQYTMIFGVGDVRKSVIQNLEFYDNNRVLGD